MRTYFLQTFSYTVTEHDPVRPWLIIGQERRSIDLEDGRAFFVWAAKNWPADRFTVNLDPWQLQRPEQ